MFRNRPVSLALAMLLPLLGCSMGEMSGPKPTSNIVRFEGHTRLNGETVGGVEVLWHGYHTNFGAPEWYEPHVLATSDVHGNYRTDETIVHCRGGGLQAVLLAVFGSDTIPPLWCKGNACTDEVQTCKFDHEGP